MTCLQLSSILTISLWSTSFLLDTSVRKHCSISLEGKITHKTTSSWSLASAPNPSWNMSMCLSSFLQVCSYRNNFLLDCSHFIKFPISANFWKPAAVDSLLIYFCQIFTLFAQDSGLSEELSGPSSPCLLLASHFLLKLLRMPLFFFFFCLSLELYRFSHESKRS